MSTISQARLAANRQNAQLSTGPRTPDGKDRSSRNAVKLGLFSKQLVLAGEDPKEFEQLRDGLHDSLQPADVFEAVIVDRVVSATWKLQRVAKAERLLYLQGAISRRNALGEEVRQTLQLPPREPYMQDGMRVLRYPPLPPDLAATVMLAESNPALEKLQKHEQKLESSILRWMKELRDFRKSLAANPASTAEESNRQNEASEDAAPNATQPASNEMTPMPSGENEPKPSVYCPATAAIASAAAFAISLPRLGETRMVDPTAPNLISEDFSKGVPSCPQQAKIAIEVLR